MSKTSNPGKATKSKPNLLGRYGPIGIAAVRAAATAARPA